MNESRHFTSRIAVMLAVAALVGTSAFAESRHPKTTDSRDKARETVQRDRSVAPAPVRAGRADVNQPRPAIADRSDRVKGGTRDGGDAAAREKERAYDLSRSRAERGNHNQGSNSNNGSNGGNWNRGDDRSSSSHGGGHGKRMPYYAHGRVSKVHPYGNGYRVWVYGAPYPFFVPTAYYHHGYFNVGTTIRVGGYYNPRGYYDYYGDYESKAIAGERLRGVVESVDHRRGEFVINLAGRGGYVTVRMPDRCERLWDGAYVVVYGDWTRSGRFVANDVDVIDDDYRW